MKNNLTNNGRARFLAAASAIALFATVPVASTFAQGAPVAQADLSNTRWRPFSGCWVPEENAAVGSNAVAGTMVCISPVAGTEAADVATIMNKQVLHSERVNATGARINKTVDKCPGWESATWSEDKSRLLLRSEFSCSDNLTVKGSGVFSLNADGEWIQIQGTTVGTNAGARVVRYRPADVALTAGTVLTDSAMVTTVPAEKTEGLAWFRQFTGRAPTTAAVLDLSKHVDEQVAQAWLTEVGQPIKVNAKELVTLADAGMPASIIDLMVAMSYPERFQLQARAGGDNEPRPVNANFTTDKRPTCVYDRFDRFDRMYSRMDQMNCVNRYGSMYGVYPFGYLSGWQYGWGNYGFGYDGYGRNYYGNSPIIIVTRPSEGTSEPQPRGRAVKGGGYTRDTGTGSSTPRQATSGSGSSSGSSSSSSPSSTSTGSSSGSSGSGSSGGGEARTAKPRTPPPLN